MPKFITAWLTIVLSTLITLGVASAPAQVTKIENTEGNQPEIIKMTVSPAAEPRPALKYRLLVPPVDQVRGNAATLYYKAMSFEGPDEIEVLSKFDSNDENDHLFFEAPLDQLPQQKADELTRWLRDETGYGLWLANAAHCDYCNWEDTIREQGIYMMLPQIQKIRGLTRALVLRARLQMAQHKTDEALETLRLGYALSCHLGRSTTLVQCLVGIGIQGFLDEQTRTLISTENSPNLYWALTDLAAHPVDNREALSYESHFWEFTIHELPEIQRRVLTADEALHAAQKLADTMWPMAGIYQGKHMRPEEILGIAVYMYPTARDYLLGHGYKAEQIDAMPMVQAILLMWWKQYELVRDDTFKWAMLPDDEARLNFQRMNNEVLAAAKRGEGGIFTDALSAITPTISARIRHERQINLLRTVEALRMYAADHGRWPEKLDDVTEVPVPLDPWSQKPFEYSLKEGVAYIERPSSPKAAWPLNADQRYELTLRSSAATRTENNQQEK